jgi:hypothetical protein
MLTQDAKAKQDTKKTLRIKWSSLRHSLALRAFALTVFLLI